MQRYDDNNAMRIVSAVMAAFLLVLILFSAVFVAAESGHHCEDKEHCPICSCMEICEEILHKVGAVPALSVILSFFCCIFTYSFTSQILFVFQPTLVSRKIRLND